METWHRSALDRRGICWFLAIAFGLAWLLELPMLLSQQGLRSSWAQLITLANLTPAIATFIVARWISPLPRMRLATGLRWGAKGSRWGWYWLFGWLGFAAMQAASPFVGALFGRFPLDLVHFSGYRAYLEGFGLGRQLLELLPLPTLAWLVLATLPLQALLVSPLNFGEEWGWRGYLLPRLLPLGQWNALLLSGVIWSCWHAPLVLRGFDYPGHSLLGVVLALIPFTLLGIFLGWTRLATGSVWPAVLGHARIDSVQVLGALRVPALAGVAYDSTQVYVTGWTGWLLLLAVLAVLVITHRLPVRNPPDLAGAARSAPAAPPATYAAVV